MCACILCCSQSFRGRGLCDPVQKREQGTDGGPFFNRPFGSEVVRPARFLRFCGLPKPPKPLTHRTYTKRQLMWARSPKTHTQNRQCTIHFLRLMLLRSMHTHTHTHTPAHWRQRVGGADQSKCGLKRTPRDTHLHINRGSPYQKQRGLSSQPTSSGTGRGERGLKRTGGGDQKTCYMGGKVEQNHSLL